MSLSFFVEALAILIATDIVSPPVLQYLTLSAHGCNFNTTQLIQHPGGFNVFIVEDFIDLIAALFISASEYPSVDVPIPTIVKS